MRAAFVAFMVAVGTLLLSPPALGEASECAAIADRSARLQCFTAVPEIRAMVGRVIDGDTIDICIGASCIQRQLVGHMPAARVHHDVELRNTRASELR
jgi:hypothetical protein